MKLFILTLGVAVLSISPSLYSMGEGEEPEELINQSMCDEHNHHYNNETHTCIYCAQHLRYKGQTGKCEGNLSPLGKCFGNHHFHAATLECMYCAKGYEFNEETRKCESTQIILAD